MSTSPMETSTLRAMRRRSRDALGALAVAGACAVALPAATQASSSSAAASYCAKLPASKVSSIVGSKASFKSPVIVKTTLECEYTAGASFVLLLKEPGIPASGLATRAKAEATAQHGFPAGTKVHFSPAPTLGATAFSWSATINGLAFAGVGENKGTTGYGVEVSGKSSVSELEKLIALAIAD